MNKRKTTTKSRKSHKMKLEEGKKIAKRRSKINNSDTNTEQSKLLQRCKLVKLKIPIKKSVLIFMAEMVKLLVYGLS